MADYALSSIVEAAEQKYGDLRITLDTEGTVVTLRNALRLGSEARAKLIRLQKDLERIQAEDEQAEIAKAEAEKAGEPVEDDGDDSDSNDAMIDNLRDTVRVVADSAQGADLLLDALGDDVPALLELFETYAKVAQPGEASPSAA